MCFGVLDCEGGIFSEIRVIISGKKKKMPGCSRDTFPIRALESKLFRLACGP